MPGTVKRTFPVVLEKPNSTMMEMQNFPNPYRSLRPSTEKFIPSHVLPGLDFAQVGFIKPETTVMETAVKQSRWITMNEKLLHSDVKKFLKTTRSRPKLPITDRNILRKIFRESLREIVNGSDEDIEVQLPPILIPKR